MVMNPTRENVLNIAQELVQTRGFNAFSFREVAERAGIRAASVHHYYPTKMDLCHALIARQRSGVNAALEQIDLQEQNPHRKLVRYVSVFQATLEAGNRMCLCGMLASDFATLDPTLVQALRLSFEDQETWISGVLSEGKVAGIFRFDASSRDEARLLLAGLEGAMLVARAFEDLSRFDASWRCLLAKLQVESVHSGTEGADSAHRCNPA